MAQERESFVDRIRNLGPGVLISIAIHAIILTAALIWGYKEYVSKEEVVPINGFQAFKPPTPQQQEPEKLEIERKGIPKNLEAELSPRKEDEVSDEEIPDLTIDNAVESDHNERDTGADDNSTGGDDVFSSYTGHTGNKGLSSAIGVGGGGNRGGGRGHGLGGRRNLVSRGKKGATQGTQAAVLYGLTWLARHQMPDGSWDATQYQDRCSDASCTGPGNVRFSDGLTGLATLAFLGAGYSHDSKQFVKDPKSGEKIYFGEVVKKALKYLVDKQQPDGSFGSDKYMYNQAICAMAVGEAYALTGARFFREPAQKALDFIQTAQNSDPSGTGKLGWRYQPMEGQNDTSVTGWCIMALKSGELANLKVDPQAMEGGLKWVKQCTNSEQKTGYLSAGDAGQKIENPEELGKFDHHESMTAVGMMIRTFVTFEWRDPAMEKGASILVTDAPTWEPQSKRDFYWWYYASLALNQYSGPDSPNPNKTYWNKWNEKLVAALVNHQENVPPNQPNPKDYVELYKEAGEHGCKTGSWEASDRFGYAGRIYATAINVLTLEVYYRFDNAFGSSKRQAGKAAEKPAAAPEKKEEKAPEPTKSEGK